MSERMAKCWHNTDTTEEEHNNSIPKTQNKNTHTKKTHARAQSHAHIPLRHTRKVSNNKNMNTDHKFLWHHMTLSDIIEPQLPPTSQEVDTQCKHRTLSITRPTTSMLWQVRRNTIRQNGCYTTKRFTIRHSRREHHHTSDHDATSHRINKQQG